MASGVNSFWIRSCAPEAVSYNTHTRDLSTAGESLSGETNYPQVWPERVSEFLNSLAQQVCCPWLAMLHPKRLHRTWNAVQPCPHVSIDIQHANMTELAPNSTSLLCFADCVSRETRKQCSTCLQCFTSTDITENKNCVWFPIWNKGWHASCKTFRVWTLMPKIK